LHETSAASERCFSAKYTKAKSDHLCAVRTISSIQLRSFSFFVYYLMCSIDFDDEIRCVCVKGASAEKGCDEDVAREIA
jgi:hypothetical protein